VKKVSRGFRHGAPLGQRNNDEELFPPPTLNLQAFAGFVASLADP
jgi:hypothetical protein